MENNSDRPKAYIKSKYITSGVPNTCYIPETTTIAEIKEKYGLRYYKMIERSINDFLCRTKKCPMVNKKLSY